MWRQLKPLTIGFAAAVTVFVTGLAIYHLVFRNGSNAILARIGMELYFLGAVMMLFLPAFASGWIARRRGALYGVVLAGIPIVLFSLVVHGTPTAIYLMWLAVAAVGGHFGEVMGLRQQTQERPRSESDSP